MKLHSLTVVTLIAFATPSELVAQTQLDNLPQIDATEEASPPIVKAEEDCNLACQLAKIKLVPGGGGGIAAGKDIETMGGFELGVTRPAAESFQIQELQ